MELIPTTELRRNLTELVRRCIAGEQFELESYGKPIGVMLGPVSPSPRQLKRDLESSGAPASEGP